MSFISGPIRPPRRESSKNIDFRRLADINDDEQEEVLTTQTPNFMRCQICQQLFIANDTTSNPKGRSSMNEYIETLRRIFVDVRSEFDENNLDFCLECHQQIDRIKVIEDEANKIRQNLTKIYLQRKNERAILKNNEIGSDLQNLDKMVFANISLKVVDMKSGAISSYNQQEASTLENSSTRSNLQLMSRQSSLNEDSNQSINDLSEVLNQGKPKVRIPSPPTFFVSSREMSHLEQRSHKNSLGLQLDEMQIKQFAAKYEVTPRGKLLIASSDVMHSKLQKENSGKLICLDHCGKNYESLLSLLNHQSKLELKSDSLKSENLSRNKSKEYQCNFCQVTFTRRIVYKQHLETHHPEDAKLSCSVCSKICSGKEDLEEHQKSHQEKPFSCPSCGKCFTRKAYLLEHEARHKGLKDRECPVCHKKFYNTSFWRHMSVVHGKLVHACSKCDRKFSHLFLLKNHEQSHLPYDKRQFMCSKCFDGKRFPTINRLKAHEKQVHGTSEESSDDSKLCPDCGAIFHSASSYNSHRKRQHCLEGNSRILAYCDECPLTFATSASLRRHVQSSHNKLFSDSQEMFIHGEEELDTILEIQTFDDVTRMSNCDDVTRMSNEIYFQHEDEDLASCIDEKNFIISHADVIDQSYVTPSSSQTQFLLRTASLDELALSSSGHFVESSLSTVQVYSLPNFAQQTSLEDTDTSKETFQVISLPTLTQESSLSPSFDLVENKTSNDLPVVSVFPCRMCDKTFASAKTRSQHKLNMHSTGKAYECKICQNIFNTKAELKEHGSSHSKEKPFRCSTCERSFKMSKDLKRHIRVHTGEKPFKCTDCDKRFSSSSNLSEHRTLHTGKMNYQCKKCAKKFRIWTSLKKHSLRCSADQSKPVTSLDLGIDNSEDTFPVDHLALEGSAIYVFDSSDHPLLQ